MAKSANLYARIEPEVKEQAEAILSALGIPASNAIPMFYKQVILQRGLPFEVKPPGPPAGRQPYDGRTDGYGTGEGLCPDEGRASHPCKAGV